MTDKLQEPFRKEEGKERPQGPEWMSERPRKALEQLYKWTRFIGISGSIISAFILLNGLALFANPAAAEQALGGALPGVDLRGIALLYVAFGAAYIFPMRHLLKFSRQIELYFKREQMEQAVEALISISSFFKIIGVVILLFLGVYILGMMGSIVSL
ncbi:MAG: Uncharacterised protein [Flavobacteriia bacterium]|nr:MAG: Uncharacterised protein [Flavobacteriia bacterium]